MSADIGPDDMVMIVRPAPCGCIVPGTLVPWTVRAVHRAFGGFVVCRMCRTFFACSTFVTSKERQPNGAEYGATLGMLIKINPPGREDEDPAPPVALPEEALT